MPKIEDLRVAFAMMDDLQTSFKTTKDIRIHKSEAFDLLDGISAMAKEVKRQLELKGI